MPQVKPRAKLDLVGLPEVAEMLGVNRVTVGKWRQRGIFPDPVVELPKRVLWYRDQITEWAQLTGRSLVA